MIGLQCQTYRPVCFCVSKVFLKLLFLLQINIFLVFSDHLDVLISKVIFLKLKKKYYLDAFPSKKHFEKQQIPYFQTPLSRACDFNILYNYILLF